MGGTIHRRQRHWKTEVVASNVEMLSGRLELSGLWRLPARAGHRGRSHDHDELAAGRDLFRRGRASEVAQRSATNLLVQLGELPADGCAPAGIARDGQVMERGADAT